MFLISLNRAERVHGVSERMFSVSIQSGPNEFVKKLFLIKVTIECSSCSFFCCCLVFSESFISCNLEPASNYQFKNQTLEKLFVIKAHSWINLGK